MTLLNSTLSIFFFIIFYFSFLKRNMVFEKKWDILKKIFFLIYPFYFLLIKVQIAIKVAIGLVLAVNLLNQFLFKDDKVKKLLQIVSMLGIIFCVNYYIGKGITNTTYVGVSYCFAAFFITFFDIVLNLSSQIFMKVIFMVLANILVLHILFASITVSA